jgi:ribonucleoside-diphosphate reductase alpha chain
MAAKQNQSPNLDHLDVATQLRDEEAAGNGVHSQTAAVAAFTEKGKGLTLSRLFTTGASHPFDELMWERRNAVITNEKGEKVFEQQDVEAPSTWSQMATNVVVSKYFNGKLGTPNRETSVRQLVDRVARTIRKWGEKGGYFATLDDANIFYEELVHLLVTQKMSFNSPVWFNTGIEERPQCSACQPYHALINTVYGPMPIGEIIEKNLIGLPVYDESGLTQVVAVKHNGRKQVYRVQLNDGFYVEATGDHLVCAHDVRRTHTIQWRRVDELKAGMVMRVYPHTPETITPPSQCREISEAALAGWLQADGFVGQYTEGTNRSLTIEFMTAHEQEYEWVMSHLQIVFPEHHYKVRDVDTDDKGLRCRRIRLYGEVLRPFVEKYELFNRGAEIRVPKVIWTASNEAVVGYLRSVFQAEGYATTHGNSTRIALAVISEDWAHDLQILLTRLGIYSRLRRKEDKRNDRHDTFEIDISILSERHQFNQKIGFLAERKQARLEESLELTGKICPDVRFAEIVSIELLGEMEVYDIQTLSGHYLTNAVLVHNCFINSVDDRMESILELAKTEGMLFKWGSGTGTNLSTLRSSKEKLSSGGTASGPVSFMRGYDAFAGVIKSGGKTRRAAKMVILNIDHPDVVEFIHCKADEEKKAWALIDAGYDGSFNGEAYNSIFFQNANHSVRVTDEFMHAIRNDGIWQTRAVTTGEVMATYKARDLMRRIAEAAWVCGDPGMQFDTTNNAWHTCPNSGRINASNPCSEYVFLDDTACNLASLNLMKFRKENGEFDLEAFQHAVHITILAQEIIVDNASYPTPAIDRKSHEFRTLGLGYANLGALLMAAGIPYDSDAGRAYAAAITALMCGQAYKTSALIASKLGPFPAFELNRKPMLGVIKKHSEHVNKIDRALVSPELFHAAKKVWEDAYALGSEYGYKNAQVTVLAPTGTIGFMMDCDTTGVEPDIALVKYKRLVGGGLMKIVNQTVPEALRKLGYTPAQIRAILDYIDQHDTIEGAPGLKPEHLPVFDCAFKPANGTRSIHYVGHVKMMAAVQPFLSGAISKTVNMPNEVTPEDIANTYIEAWKLGLKAIAIYRDGCKRTQPLVTKLDTSSGKQSVTSNQLPVISDRQPVEAEQRSRPWPAQDRLGGTTSNEQPATSNKPTRRRLPDERESITHKFSIAGHEGYITAGMYEDGALGEIFIVMAKEGSVVSGLMDSFATAISLALQYGVPLPVLVRKFTHTRFEPSGFTTNPQIPIAKSIMDYIFRWLALKFLPEEERSQVLAESPDENTNGASSKTLASIGAVELENQIFESQSDAPPCPDCGSVMVRSGSCYKCVNCGGTSGCS